MECTKHAVPCKGCTYSYFCRFPVTYSADDQYVRVLPQQSPQSILKSQSSFFVDLALAKSIDP